ncbi:IST1 family protein [Phanerochaete sordida]|uniref:IST1 family protein n=1 Tax=Phanerochaete sordida TaxID=48140 RepID=A0A9P3LHD3_9APHY|nr:IST1 family protein [Phanerochaete sordida]
MTSWDSNRVKNQLRLTAQRLGQLQDKLDSQGQITRRDIAILLGQGNVALARAKAQKCIHDDIYSDLLQTLEMHVGIILEQVDALERSATPSPVVAEAASSIIYAAPHVESRDLQVVRDLLVQRLGPDFTRSAVGNRDNYVATRVVRDLSSQPPSASMLDHFLRSVAKANGIHWKPDLETHQKVDTISGMLDATSIPSIDIHQLQSLCSHGLPEYPPWLRPKIWRLLLGTLPPQKARWEGDASKQRDNYYDLVRQLLEPYTSLPPPTNPLSPLDSSLAEVQKELSRVPRALFANLGEEPEDLDQSPLSDSAVENIKIACAKALDTRLQLIRDATKSGVSTPTEEPPEIQIDSTPEIRLEGIQEQDIDEHSSRGTEDLDDSGSEAYLDAASIGTPEISLSAPDSPTSAHSAAQRKTLVKSRPYSATGAHPKHETALIRLLYIHFSLNPAHRAPQTASLLVPLYSALVQEVIPEDAAHIEADTFWLFETFVSEFSDLDEPESAEVWLKKLGERLNWADAELAEDLQTKGLDPSSPHFTYRWLTTLLTHTLPLPAVLMTWDALFAQPSRERSSNPKLEYLLDICASMLICARGPLFRLGRRPGKPLNLWGESSSLIMSELLSDRELEEAFIQGMAFLQNYPLENVGGIERVLQLAFDLAAQREKESQASITQVTAAGLGARLRNTVWRSTAAPAPVAAKTPAPAAVAQLPVTADDDSTDSDSDSSEDEDDGAQTIPVVNVANQSSLTSRLSTAVWKGITNQSAMEAPPTPTTPSPSFMPSSVLSPKVDASKQLPPEPRSPPADGSAQPSITSNIWGYAEKLRDSNAAATFSKVSTNWRVKAMDAWSKRSSVGSTPHTAPLQASSSTLSPSWVPSSPATRADSDIRRSSLPPMGKFDDYEPPERPKFFRPPRDSMIIDPRRDSMASLASPTNSEMSAHSEGDLDLRRSSMMGRTPSPRSATTRSGGPKPLILNSTSLITHSRSPTMTTSSMDSHFADQVRATRPTISHRTSQSSLSSLSPSDQLASGRMRTPEGESRVVPIGRARSPAAFAKERRQGSLSSATSSPIGTTRRLPSDYATEVPERKSSGWRNADFRDSTGSAASVVSPPAPASPPKQTDSDEARVVPTEHQRGSVVLSEFGELERPVPPDATPKISRKTNSSLSRLQLEESSDSSPVTQLPSRASRVKSKRLPPRLAGRQREASKDGTARATSPNTLVAALADDGDATTPKASDFEVGGSPSKTRKNSGESRMRKTSADGVARTRKVSNEGKPRRVRDSAAVEGDDEGYDEFLSAYSESEDGGVAR